MPAVTEQSVEHLASIGPIFPIWMQGAHKDNDDDEDDVGADGNFKQATITAAEHTNAANPF
jgi:hypothetical protein